MNIWDNFHKYYQWEFDIICASQKNDVEFWQKMVEVNNGKILELGCGAGRITIPLGERGYDITALDYSEQMIAELKKNSHHIKNITPILGDMTNFKFEKKFKFVFISYSSFQLLLTRDAQQKCLNLVYEHLENDGVVGIDIATSVCEGEDTQQKTLLYSAEYPEDSSIVSMFTSYTTDRLNFIRHWEDEYIHHKSGANSSYINHLSLKDCNMDYMHCILENCGFEVEHTYGDFKFGELNEESYNALYVAKKIKSAHP